MKAQHILPVLFVLAAITAVQAAKGFSAKVLDNGMEIIVVENHTVPLVTIEAVFRNGAFTEAEEENGLTNLHAHMLFNASQAYPNRAASLQRAGELGIVMKMSIEGEWENFHITLHSDSLVPGLEYIWQAIQYPLFTGDDLAREKQEILGQIDGAAGNPSYHMNQALLAKLWGRNASRKDYLGDRDVIRNATLRQVRLIQDRYTIPNNAALLVTGDVNSREVFKLVKRLFGSWEAGTDPAVSSPVPAFPPLTANEDTVVVQPVNNARITLAWHGPSVPLDRRHTFAADVFSFIVNQKTSELKENLIDSGLALSVETVYLTRTHGGHIFINVTCRPQKFWEACQALLDEVEKFDDPDYFTDEQLANAKTLLEVSYIYAGDKASNLIQLVAFWWSIAGLDYYRDYLDNLRAVSRDDIVEYVQRYIIGKPYVIVAMVDRQTQRELQVVEGSLVR